MGGGGIVIAGAGPAGMMLAYQLASNGVEVRVLEQHPDFEREFRGELIGPSVLPVLDSLGILPRLVERGLARRDVERRMFVGPRRRVTLPMGKELGALVSQPGLLALLHEQCSRFPSYRMDFDTSVLRAVRDGERVVAFDTKSGGVAGRTEGELLVVCNGRNSRLRRDLGLELELEVKPDDTLWLRFDFSDAKELLPNDVHVHMFGGGVVVVVFATCKHRLQIAYSAPGDLGALRKDLPALRQAVLPRIAPNELAAAVARKMDEGMESQLLKVSIDRLKQWHLPGLLFLGDAAHTMGPAGAQGLNLAIRDSIVAANHILEAKKSGGALDDALALIEAERRPEIEASQAGQLRAYRMVHKPLAVEHMMFTVLGLVMKVKTFAAPQPAAVAPKYPVPAA